MKRLIDSRASVQGDPTAERALALLESAEEISGHQARKDRVRRALRARSVKHRKSKPWLVAGFFFVGAAAFAARQAAPWISSQWADVIQRKEARTASLERTAPSLVPEVVVLDSIPPSAPASDVGNPIPPSVPVVLSSPVPGPETRPERSLRPRAADAVQELAPRSLPPDLPPAITSTPATVPGGALLLDAIRSLRQGATTEALSQAEEYLRMFPEGPLQEEALATAVQAMSRSSDPRTAARADEYLQRFPEGRFRSEALRAKKAASSEGPPPVLP